MEPRALARRGNPAPFFSKKSDNDIILLISRWQTCSSLVDWVSLRSTLMCQLSGFSNMRNALQSRRDYMFIAPNVLNLFRSVGAIFGQRFC